jgi:hypothetical protein
MDWQGILETLWAALNSPAGITAMAGGLIWSLNWLYARKPLWQRYEGAVIAAVKFAEKNIDDQTPNKGLARLDAALRYVLKVHESARGRAATGKEIRELTDGIQIVHANLEANGQL